MYSDRATKDGITILNPLEKSSVKQFFMFLISDKYFKSNLSKLVNV